MTFYHVLFQFINNVKFFVVINIISSVGCYYVTFKVTKSIFVVVLIIAFCVVHCG